MSTEYTTVTDRLVELLTTYKTTKLSEDLTTDVAIVKKGQYVPNATTNKPCIYVRLRRAGAIRSMAGNLLRDERLKFFFSGAATGATQDAAWDEVQALANNLEHVLENFCADGDYWAAGGLGWNYPEDREQGDDFLEIEADQGQDICVVHFTLLWSCEIRIERDTL